MQQNSSPVSLEKTPEPAIDETIPDNIAEEYDDDATVFIPVNAQQENPKPAPQAAPVSEPAPQAAKPAKKAKKSKARSPKSKELIRKNVTSTIVYIVSAAIVAGIGIFALPKFVIPFVNEKVAEKMLDDGKAANALNLYRITQNTDAIGNAKLTIAKDALESENYAYAAAIFSELESMDFDTDDDLTSYIDEAFGGRCRALINGGKYNLAAADATQISDELLSASVANDTLISRAKVLSSEGKTVEAYEMVTAVNTSAAYDSEAYNVIAYNYAVSLYNEMNFEKAYNILTKATDDASVELRNSSAYHFANELLKNKDYEKAAEMFENANGYSDSDAKIKECNYQLGLINYNKGNYDAALGYFEKANGYKESASYISKIEEKVAYTGWEIDAYTSNYYNPVTNLPGSETTLISAYDEFVYSFTLSNANNNTNGVTIKITITTPDYQTASETFYNVYNGDSYCYSAYYEYPEFGATGTATFTATLVETGEVLDVTSFTIY